MIGQNNTILLFLFLLACMRLAGQIFDSNSVANERKTFFVEDGHVGVGVLQFSTLIWVNTKIAQPTGHQPATSTFAQYTAHPLCDNGIRNVTVIKNAGYKKKVRCKKKRHRGPSNQPLFIQGAKKN